MRCLPALFKLLLVLLYIGPAEAQVLRYREGQMSFFTRFEVFSTDSNFDPSGGSFTKLPAGQSYDLSLIKTRMQYDYTNDFAFYGGVNFAIAKSNDGLFTRNNSTLTGFEGGLQYKAMKKPFLIVPQIHVILPFETISNNTDQVISSESAVEVEVGVWLQKKLWRLYNYAYFGFDYRDGGRSALGKYKLGTYARIKNFYMGLDANGYQSISDDENTNTPFVRTVITNQVNGSSLKYYSINPDNLSVDLWAGMIAFENYLFKVGYAQDVNGSNSAKGSTVYVGLDIRNFYLKSKKVRSQRARRKRINNLNDQFQPEEDTLDDGELDEDKIEKDLEVKVLNKN